jgi:hypothetical protein
MANEYVRARNTGRLFNLQNNLKSIIWNIYY